MASSVSVSAFTTESESLHTPVLTSTPSPTPFTAGMVFTYPSAPLDTSSSISSHAASNQGKGPQSRTPEPCGIAHRRSSSSGDQSDHSLHSPTILTLWLVVFLSLPKHWCSIWLKSAHFCVRVRVGVWMCVWKIFGQHYENGNENDDDDDDDHFTIDFLYVVHLVFGNLILCVDMHINGLIKTWMLHS